MKLRSIAHPVRLMPYSSRPRSGAHTTGAPSARGISRFSCIECPRMLRVSDSAGPVGDSLSIAAHRVAFPAVRRGWRPKRVISEPNGSPTLSPVNASRAASRLPAHDSGPSSISYSFHVGLFYPLRYAGLSRRFPSVPISF